METPLKQRLIGAIVLVALAVIFLPMLVKGPAPDSGVQDVPLQAPAAPAPGQFETRELPLVAPTAPAGGAVGMPATVPADTAAPAAPAAAANGLPAAVAAGNYAVNFGAYASEADADAVIAHLKKSNLPGFRQADTINGRQAWRVRIGPYADRAQAELVRLEAGKVRNDVNAQVVVLNADAAPVAAAPSTATPAPAPAPVRSEPLPPEPKPVAAAPRPEPAKPEPPKPATPKPEPKPEPKPVAAAPAAPAASNVGFAVQLGAFGQAADANALRDRARAAGFSAFVEQVRTDNGVLNRVRVGPVANRAAAEQLKAQVAAKVGVAGMVRPHP
ncbi:MAG: SPOR domain-containing protein [Stenotrophomonas sp.]